MATKALVLGANGLRDCYLLFAFHAVQDAGADVDVAAPRPGIVVGERGYALAATVAVADVRPGDYGLLVVPGLNGREHLCLDRVALSLTQEFILAGRAVAPVCLRGRIGMMALGSPSGHPVGGSGEPRRGDAREWVRRVGTHQCPEALPDSCRAMFEVLRRYCRCPGVTLSAVPPRRQPALLARGL